MELRVLFNSNSIHRDLSVGWGLSCLINKRILFDTGEKASLLMNNIEKLEIDMDLIEAIVISHDHWDHTGGLQTILKKRKGIKVYACPGFGDEFRHKVKDLKGVLIENETFSEIKPKVFTTGEIVGDYKSKSLSEQSLVIETDQGLVVVTGCAHPGIIKILQEVQRNYPRKQIFSVLGGFHLQNTNTRNVQRIVHNFEKMNIQKVGATHCTGSESEEIFKKVYKNNFLSMKVGERIVIA